MKQHIGTTVLIVLFCAIAATAQQEQWLEYRSSAQGREVGPAAGQQPALSTTRPAGVAMPTFHSERPYFARWVQEADAAASQPASRCRWIALDQSAKGGAYDRLYIDANGDGSLADEKPIAAQSNDYGSYARFERVRVDLPGPEGLVAYHLNIMASMAMGRNMYISPAGWYSGPVKVAGDSYWCVLVDANANGRFNDASTDPRQCDFLCLYPLRGSATEYPYQDDARHFVGEYVQVADALYRLSIAADAASVSFEPVAWPDRVAVKVPPGLTQLSVWSKQGHFVAKAKDGQVLLPPGEYSLNGWQAEKKDAGGAVWTLIGKWSGTPAQSITVAAGTDNSVNVGEPIVVAFADSAEGPIHQITPTITGSLGSGVTIMQGQTQIMITSLRITAPAGYEKIVSLEYG